MPCRSARLSGRFPYIAGKAGIWPEVAILRRFPRCPSRPNAEPARQGRRCAARLSGAAEIPFHLPLRGSGQGRGVEAEERHNWRRHPKAAVNRFSDLVRAGGLEPPQALRPYGCSYQLRLAPPPGWAFVVWTIPSPCPADAGGRCCPSSLYTFPFPGLARDCHLTGFPEFEQFYCAGFPASTQVFV